MDYKKNVFIYKLTFAISLSFVILEARVEYICVTTCLPSFTSFKVLFKLVDRNSYNTSRPNGVPDIDDTTDV